MWSFVLYIFFRMGVFKLGRYVTHTVATAIRVRNLSSVVRVLVEQSTMVDLKAFVTANQRNKINPEQEAVSFQCRAVYNIE